ncbi:MAG: DoxX family protein [Bdellovibrionales bacterium]|nr:DoxX family protein [Bdellovibrionales bacterium]
MINKFLFSTGEHINHLTSHLGLLFLRLFAGLTMAFAHGVDKIPPHEQFIGFLDSMGFPVPFMFAWMAALAEFVGSLLVALGLLTRPAAFTVMTTMLVAAFMAHANDPFQKKEMALLYFFIFLLFFLVGPGKYSLDSKIINKK